MLLLSQEFFDPQRLGRALTTGETTLAWPFAILLVFGLLGNFVIRLRYLLGWLWILIFLIPTSQRVIVADIDFSAARVLVFGAWLRVALEYAALPKRLCVADVLVMSVLVGEVLCAVLRGDSGSAASGTGSLVEIAAIYFTSRMVFEQDEANVSGLLTCLAIGVSIQAVLLSGERALAANWFSQFGGRVADVEVRGGSVRAMGAIAHPILAGVAFSGLLAPLLWYSGVLRPGRLVWTRFLAVPSCLVCIWAAGSATAWASAGAGLLFYSSWTFRRLIPAVLGGLLAASVALSLLPGGVFSIVLRIPSLGGTAWHRYNLYSETLSRLPDWALVGTSSTYHWGWGLDDITSEWLIHGIRGGILCFIGMVGAWWVIARGLYHSCLYRRAAEGPGLHWAMLSCMVALAVGNLSVSVFGQLVFETYILLGLAASLCAKSSN